MSPGSYRPDQYIRDDASENDFDDRSTTRYTGHPTTSWLPDDRYSGERPGRHHRSNLSYATTSTPGSICTTSSSLSSMHAAPTTVLGLVHAIDRASYSSSIGPGYLGYNG